MTARNLTSNLTLALLLAAAPLAAQREALTVDRLLRSSTVVGLFTRGETRALPSNRQVVLFSCVTPIKGVQARQEVTVLRHRPLCMTPDVGSVARGARVILFLRSTPEGPHTVQANGLITPGDEATTRGLAALHAARGRNRVEVLVDHLEHARGRLRQDAVFALFRTPTADLEALGVGLRPRLLRRVRETCRHPSATTTWTLRLAARVKLAAAAPEITRLFLRQPRNGAARSFLAGTLKRLDAKGAVRTLEGETLTRPARAQAAADLLATLGVPEGVPLLEKLAVNRTPGVRSTALTTLARVAPDRPIVRLALRRDTRVRTDLTRALHRSRHPKAVRVLREERRLTPAVDRVARVVESQKPPRPVFKALFKRPPVKRNR